MWKSMKNTDPEFMEYSSRVQEGGRCGDLRSKKEMHQALWDGGL